MLNKPKFRHQLRLQSLMLVKKLKFYCCVKNFTTPRRKLYNVKLKIALEYLFFHINFKTVIIKQVCKIFGEDVGRSELFSIIILIHLKKMFRGPLKIVKLHTEKHKSVSYT